MMVACALSFTLCLASSAAGLQALDRQLAGEQGSKLDVYELEVANERGDALQDLAEFQLAAVSSSNHLIYWQEIHQRVSFPDIPWAAAH